MRSTISIPDEYYNRIKVNLKDEGYGTINEFLVDLLRHHFDVHPLKEKPQIIKTPVEAQKKVSDLISNFQICEHGARKGLCRMGCT